VLVALAEFHDPTKTNDSNIKVPANNFFISSPLLTEIHTPMFDRKHDAASQGNNGGYPIYRKIAFEPQRS